MGGEEEWQSKSDQRSRVARVIRDYKSMSLPEGWSTIEDDGEEEEEAE